MRLAAPGSPEQRQTVLRCISYSGKVVGVSFRTFICIGDNTGSSIAVEVVEGLTPEFFCDVATVCDPVKMLAPAMTLFPHPVVDRWVTTFAQTLYKLAAFVIALFTTSVSSQRFVVASIAAVRRVLNTRFGFRSLPNCFQIEPL